MKIEILATAAMLVLAVAGSAKSSGLTPGTYDPVLIQPAPPALTCFTAPKGHWFFVNCGKGPSLPPQPKPKPKPRPVPVCEND
jgi:hypothetical protein